MFLRKNERGNGHNFEFAWKPESGEACFVLSSGNAQMKRIYKTINKLLHCKTPLFLEGEPGVGKKTLAHIVHLAGSHRAGSFVSIECDAINETSLYEKLSMPLPASRAKRSFSGTIILNCPEHLSANMQTCLIELIREKQLRIDKRPAIEIDARIITTTGIDIWRLVRRGSFRQDLYYRLSVYLLKLPELAQRQMDIAAFVEFFSRIYAQKSRSRMRRFSPQALEILRYSTWPRNLIDLRQAVVQSIKSAKSQEVVTEIDWENCFSSSKTDTSKLGLKTLGMQQQHSYRLDPLATSIKS